MFCCIKPTAVSPSPAPQPASKIKISVTQTDFTQEQRKTLEVALATTKVAARAKMYELNQVECSAVDRPEEPSVFFTMDQRDALEEALAATKIKTYEKSKPLAKDERLDFDIDQEIRENGSVIHNEHHCLTKYIVRRKLYYKGMGQENYLRALEQYRHFLPAFVLSMVSDIKIFGK